ncbi:MAG: hypothetical protein IJR85_10160 [Synergistaceae bacterium]|nr:hypothetical protein [Synergistaceae bacterium]
MTCSNSDIFQLNLLGVPVHRVNSGFSKIFVPHCLPKFPPVDDALNHISTDF